MKPVLLAIGDAVLSTGFARVVENILKRNIDDFEIHHIGINYFGDPHDLPWKVYPAGLGGDASGTGRLVPLIKKIRPDIIFSAYISNGY